MHPPSPLPLYGRTEAGIVSAAPQAVKLVEGGFLPFALSCNNRTTERDAFFSHRHGGGGKEGGGIQDLLQIPHAIVCYLNGVFGTNKRVNEKSE